MDYTIYCDDVDHVSCPHAPAQKLFHLIDIAETSEFQDSGRKIAVVGVRTDLWREFAIHTDKADTLLKGGAFSITRSDGNTIFVVPVDDLPHPKILNDADQRRLLKKKSSKHSNA